MQPAGAHPTTSGPVLTLSEQRGPSGFRQNLSGHRLATLLEYSALGYGAHKILPTLRNVHTHFHAKKVKAAQAEQFWHLRDCRAQLGFAH
jgi:hypothetical protein